MTELLWKNGGKANSPVLLDKIEEEYGVKLPSLYRDIVLKYNEGRPSHKLIKTITGREVVFQELLSINLEDKNNLLQCSSVLKSEYGLHGVIPFASDPFGNLFCFEISEYMELKVVFWDHEEIDNSVIPITNSFEDLLCALY